VNARHTSGSHLNIGFKLWEHGPGWFWLVVSPHSERGTIGAAPTEAEALRDARSLVEDLSAQHPRAFAMCLCQARDIG
jgi:hypothetical protein